MQIRDSEGVNINEICEEIQDITNLKESANLLGRATISCILPAVIEYKLGDNSSKFYQAAKKNPGKLRLFLRSLNVRSSLLLEILEDALKKGKGEKWIAELSKFAQSKTGKATVAMFKRINYDYTQLSLKNFEKLEKIFSKSGVTPQLERIFSGKTDINRLIHYLHRNLDNKNYPQLLQELEVNKLFNNLRITIHGKTVKYSEYVYNYSDKRVQHYVKETVNECFYIKFHPEIKEIVKEIFNKNTGKFTFEFITATQLKTTLDEYLPLIDENDDK